jgi:hypothetical protein
VDDRVALEGIVGIPLGLAPTLRLTHADGTVERVALRSTFTPEQFRWLAAGSALNALRGG